MAQGSAVATHGPTAEDSRLRAVDVFRSPNFACSAAARAILYGGNGNLVKKAQEHGVRHLPCAPLQVLRFGQA